MKEISLIRLILPIFLVILIIPKIVVLSGCANIIPPTGGPRDSLPPVLVRVNPPDSSNKFSAKTITFTFNEYIEQPQEIFRNLIVSPTPAILPVVESKLRTLTVKIKDTLEPNTTYYYNFGDAIRDVNEQNVLHNFSYIFTTGEVLDTLQLAGNVILAETGGFDSTLTVMLHRSSIDSAVVKERPRYYTKLDGQGKFRFLYLQPGTYYIYALKDDNNTRSYMSTSQLFAFADTPVVVKPGAPPVTLYAYAEKKEQPSATVSFSGGTRTGGNRADDRRLRFTTSGPVQDLMGTFSLNFDRPIRNLDTTKLQLSTDSTFNPAPSSWELDTLMKKLTLKTTWKENTLYNLILDKDFAEDTLGRKLLKTDTIRFTTKKQSDYGSVKVTFVNIDLSHNPVLQFSQNGQVVKTYPLSTPDIYEPIFNPGDYDLSILYDKNKNGRWDPGQFFGTKRQPELVRPLNKKINIKANWDNEFEIKL